MASWINFTVREREKEPLKHSNRIDRSHPRTHKHKHTSTDTQYSLTIVKASKAGRALGCRNPAGLSRYAVRTSAVGRHPSRCRPPSESLSASIRVAVGLHPSRCRPPSESLSTSRARTPTRYPCRSPVGPIRVARLSAPSESLGCQPHPSRGPRARARPGLPPDTSAYRSECGIRFVRPGA